MHNERKKQFLSVIPSRNDQGGISAYYNHISSHFSSTGNEKLILFESGSTKKRPFHWVVDQICFRNLLVSEPIDLVVVNPSLFFRSFIREGLFILQAIKRKIPVVVFFRGWNPEFAKKMTGWKYKFFRTSYAKGDVFIVLAQEFRQKLQEWGVNKPIYVEHTIVPESIVENISIHEKTEAFKNEKEVKVFFLARLTKEKGIFEALNAVFLVLRKKVPVSFTIAGEGAIASQLRALISEEGYDEKQIKLVGDVRGEEKERLLRESHVFLFPTYWGEGLPSAVLEAMAAGLFIITRPVAGIKDFFENGKMGVLVEERDPRILAQYLEQFIRNRQNYKTVAEYNRAFIKRKYLASNGARRLKMICNEAYAAWENRVRQG